MNVVEPIKNQIKKDAGFEQRLNALQQTVLSDSEIQQFIKDEKVTQSMVDRGIGKLFEYTTQQHDCSKCESVATCKNPIHGLVPQLIVERENIDIQYVPCETKRVEEARRKTASMIASMFIPKDVLKADMSTLKTNSRERMEIMVQATNFIEQVRQNPTDLPTKGFYLHGSFGVGKTFLLAAIANELAKMEVRSILVYVPEFLRELKSAIGDQTLEEKLDFVKKAPVLMLDDLGAETLTIWTRDEILGTIFHYRMAEGLPTFISSNMNYKELAHHFSKTKDDRELDIIKSERIMQRIRTLTTPIDMTGTNFRNFQED